MEENEQTTNALKPISIITIGGYIELRTSDELEQVLSQHIKNNAINLIIDLQNVDYVSSAGWGVFLAKLKEIREKNGDLKLANMTANVYEVYKILEFFWFIRHYASVDAAITDFDKEVPPMPR
jgi:anti-sigma B factor antagonist